MNQYNFELRGKKNGKRYFLYVTVNSTICNFICTGCLYTVSSDKIAEDSDKKIFRLKYEKDGFHYEFNNGDLALSIHGTTNMRLHRMVSGKTYFRIWDVYDFAGELAKFMDYFTTTNTYGITIESAYQWN